MKKKTPAGTGAGTNDKTNNNLSPALKKHLSNDWRLNLAQNNGVFRIKETYDTHATGRRLRRILDRKVGKGAKSGA